MENTARAVASARRLKPEIRLAQAISEFESSLADDGQRVQFKNLRTRRPPDFSDVVRLTEEINADGASRRGWRQHATRLVTFLDRIRQFAPIGDVLVGGAQNFVASGVWGAVRLALEVSLSFLSYFDQVSDLLLRIGRATALHQDFAIIFPCSKQLQSLVCEYLVVIVEICSQIIRYTQKHTFSQLATSIFTTFDSTFKPLESRLEDISRQLSQRTTALAMATDRKEHKSLIGRFDKLQLSSSKAASQSATDIQRHHLLTALSPKQGDYELVYRIHRRKGTARWISQEPAYRAWKASESSATLWLRGNLGSGKSVTVASVVGELLCEQGSSSATRVSDPGQQSKKPSSYTLCYFFCTAETPKPLRSSSLFGSIAYQILSTASLENLLRRYLTENQQDSRFCAEPEACVDLILQITTQDWKCMLVIDGVDELPGEELVTILAQLKRLSDARNVLLFCSSRTGWEHSDMSIKRFPGASTIFMENVDRTEDATRFISAEMESWQSIRPLSPDVEKMVQRQLELGWRGMFLWLALQMQALSPGYATDEQIDDIIHNLPQNLPKAFDRALLRITDRRYNPHIFELVAVGEPMTIDELQVAMVVKPGHLEWDPPPNQSYGLPFLWRHGGNLLEMEEESQKVRFIHPSVPMHLVGPAADARAEPFHFTLLNAERYFGSVCVTYLNFPIFDRQVAQSLQPSPDFSRTPKVVVDSVIRNSTARHVFQRFAHWHYNTREKVELEVIKAELEKMRPSVTEGREELFLEYAKANWLTATRTLDSADGTSWRLWRKLVEGLCSPVPSPFGSDEAAGISWALLNGHYSLFRYLVLGSGAGTDHSGITMSKLTPLLSLNRADIQIFGSVLAPIAIWLSDRRSAKDVFQNSVIVGHSFPHCHMVQTAFENVEYLKLQSTVMELIFHTPTPIIDPFMDAIESKTLLGVYKLHSFSHGNPDMIDEDVVEGMFWGFSRMSRAPKDDKSEHGRDERSAALEICILARQESLARRFNHDGVDPTERTAKLAYPPLFLAIRLCNPRMLRIIMETSPPPPYESVYWIGICPFRFACLCISKGLLTFENTQPMLEILLEEKVKLNSEDEEGHTPLMYELRAQITRGDFDTHTDEERLPETLIEWLIVRGASVHDAHRGFNFLHLLATLKSERAARLVELIMDHTIMPLPDSNPELPNPLMLAAGVRNLGVMRRLVECEAYQINLPTHHQYVDKVDIQEVFFPDINVKSLPIMGEIVVGSKATPLSMLLENLSPAPVSQRVSSKLRAELKKQREEAFDCLNILINLGVNIPDSYVTSPERTLPHLQSNFWKPVMDCLRAQGKLGRRVGR